MFKLRAKREKDPITPLVEKHAGLIAKKDSLLAQEGLERRAALKEGRAVDQDYLDAIVRELRDIDGTLAAIRAELLSLVTEQRCKQLREFDRLKVELEAEVVATARQAGERVGEALALLRSVGGPAADNVVSYILGALDDETLSPRFRYKVAGSPLSRAIISNFDEGIGQAPPVERDFKREMSEIQPLFQRPTTTDPGECPYFLRGCQAAVDRLLSGGQS